MNQHYRCSRPARGIFPTHACTYNAVTSVQGYHWSFACNTRTLGATKYPSVSKGVAKGWCVQWNAVTSTMTKICAPTRKDFQVHCQVKEARWRIVCRVCYPRKVGIWKYVGEFAYICINKHLKGKQETNKNALSVVGRGGWSDFEQVEEWLLWVYLFILCWLFESCRKQPTKKSESVWACLWHWTRSRVGGGK